MPDIVDKSTRSQMMAGIRAKDTKPELIVRRHLHAAGYRFRLHRTDLPGTPDIVLPKYRTAILVHGCFWHRHTKCRLAYTPKTRPQYWAEKFAQNVARDRKNLLMLHQLGWNVVIVWECAVRNPDIDLSDHLVSAIESSRNIDEIPTSPLQGEEKLHEQQPA